MNREAKTFQSGWSEEAGLAMSASMSPTTKSLHTQHVPIEQDIEETPIEEDAPEVAGTRSWADVQQDAPIFQTEGAIAVGQALQGNAVQETEAPEVCSQPTRHPLHQGPCAQINFQLQKLQPYWHAQCLYTCQR